MTIKGRLSKLEETAHPKRVVVVWQNAGESKESALTRWRQEHPDQPDPTSHDLTVYLVKWAEVAA